MPVSVTLTLGAGDRFVRVRVQGENACRDHRLRIVFHTGLAGASTVADAAFGPVARRWAVPRFRRPPLRSRDT